MKKLPLILSIIALAGVIALAVIDLTKGSKKPAPVQTESTNLAGAIVYFDLDRVLAEYDMANDLRSVFETKANSINQEVQRRVNKFQKDLNSFNDKINKGLMTQSTAQVQSQKLQEQQASVENYANQKQQEILEEQQVMLNQIYDAIKSYIDDFNLTQGYAMVIATGSSAIISGDIFPNPVVTGAAELDITDALIEGLNAKYVAEKGKSE